VEPSLQAAFIDYGGNRHGFLAFNEIHPDYYQIPVADRERLIAEEAEYAKSKAEEDAKRAEQPKSRNRRRKKQPVKVEAENNASADDPIITSDIIDDGVIDIDATSSDLVDVPEAQPADLIVTNTAIIEESIITEEPTIDVPEAEGTNKTAEETVVEDSTRGKSEKTDTSPTSEDQINDDDDNDNDNDNDDENDATDTKPKPGIESVADDDVSEELRPRKPRMKRYKIQEVVKVRQILLVQVVKEERGNKGAALTTYLSLAGRYCVLMPNTARGGGISRKITNAADRKKIKAIANSLIVPEGAGLIIRTAGASRNEADINRDYEFLSRQWEEIRQLTLKSIAPAPIYEEGNLIKRSIRDLYSRDIDEIHVEGERGYEAAKEYMKMFMPNRVDKVKEYKEQMPLFSRYQVESHLGAMFNPTVQLKSGGYLVIGITEALVAVDVNSGKATKESSIEATALKTNLEAAEEVARQMRLRDLAGLIVIDFIDMDERRNNTAVEKRLKDKLKNDRARIQIGRISGFGLLEMSRQRLRPGMLEATTQPCPHCHATGLLRSDDSLALSILRELEEEGVRKRSGEVLVKAPINVTNYLLNEKREHIATIESRYGLSIRVEADITLIGTDYSVEKFKTATRVIPQPINAPVSMENISMESFDEAVAAATPSENTDTPENNGSDDEKPKKKSRRRRGGRGRGKAKQEEVQATDTTENLESNQNADAPVETDAPIEGVQAETTTETAATEPKVESEKIETSEEVKPEKPKRKRAPRKTTAKKAPTEAKIAKNEDTGVADASIAEIPSDTVEGKPTKKAPAKAKAAPKPRAARKPAAKKVAVEKTDTILAPEPVAATEAVKTPEPVVAPEPIAAAPEAIAEKPAEVKPKRRGWWSRG
jgi:ribonuclease E